MSLHSSKRTALLQLINCMPSCDVETIKQLSDGKLFCNIIETVFSLKENEVLTQKKQNVSCEEQSKDERVCGTVNIEPEDKMICEDSKVESEDVIKKDSESMQESDIELTKSAVSGSECTITPTKPAGECVIEPIESVNRDSESITSESVNRERESITSESVIEKPEPSGSNSESLTEPPKSLDCDSKSVIVPVRFSDDISERYSLVQHFIDAKYELKSETMISISECRNANELELAKVTVFILSEVVRHYVLMNKAVIHTLSHLDIKVQQDLEQCFNFFINDRNKITKENVHKILSNHAPYKISSSPNRSSLVTPRRSCSSKYRRPLSPAASPSQESVYTDSPLKTYFESPVFTKEDIASKDKEIAKQIKFRYEEESKCCDLQENIKNLEIQLGVKDKEISDLKVRNRMLQDEISKDCEDCKEKQKIINEQKKHIKYKEAEIEEEKKEIREKCNDKLRDFQTKTTKVFSMLKLRSGKAMKISDESEAKLEEKEKKIFELELEVQRLIEQKDEVVTELNIYKEKLLNTNTGNKRPESPVLDVGECMGKYCVEEDKKLQEEEGKEKLQEKEGKEKLEEEEEKMQGENEELHNEIVKLKLRKHPEIEHVMVQFPEQHIDYSGKNESNVSVPGLLPSADLPEDEKLRNLKNSAEDVNKECPDTCDVSSKLDTTFDCSAGSSSTDIPCAENMRTPIVRDGYGYGVLWQNMNSSPPENKTSDKVSLMGRLTKCKEKLERIIPMVSSIFHRPTAPKGLSRPNGSNGFVMPISKKTLDDLKFIEEFLECLKLAESQVKFQNNNSILKCMVMTDGTELNSCSMTSDICRKKNVGTDDPNSKIANMIQKHTDALGKKEEEIESLKKILEDVTEKLEVKKVKLRNCIKRCSTLNGDCEIRSKKCKEMELKCQKLEMELRDIRQREKDIKNKEINSLKMKHLSAYKNLAEVRENLKSCRNELQKVKDENAELNKTKREVQEDKKKVEEERKEVEEDKKKVEEERKEVERKLEDVNVRLKALSRTTGAENSLLPFIKGVKDVCAFLEKTNDGFSKLECMSLSSNEVTSVNTGNESILSGALCSRRFHGDFHLVNDDEEGFLNHSNIPEINNESTGVQDNTRRQELRRRNTMLPSHMQAAYATECIFLTPDKKKLSNSDRRRNFEVRKQLDKNGHIQKKRKRSEYETENQSSKLLTTPVAKIKRTFKTPSSLQKLLQFRRNRCLDTIKPKP